MTLFLAVTAIFVACGTRTDLDVGADGPRGAGDAGRDAYSPRDADADAADGAVIITEIACRVDADCSDAVGCTIDRCDRTLGRCTRTLDHARCDDGVFCDGAERCDAVRGCTAGAARACADSFSCTVDTCDERSKSCLHAPDDSRCPISHTCDPALGCQARALAIDATTLYEVRLPSGQVNAIGKTGAVFTDVALAPSNVLYGVGSSGLYEIDQASGASTFVAASREYANALDSAPDGEMYAAGVDSLYRLDPTTGAVTKVATFPAGTTSSGDIAFVGSRLLATATGGGDDELVELDVTTGTSHVVGPVGYRCVWGLAAYGLTLYGLTCQGIVLSIDPSTGKGTKLNQVSVRFYGASAR